ncbi:MAG: small subunit ribosomal protein [Bacteroidales bacterium]|nr:small subunit ribosomal protein [Bacteroidales bacterium]
MIVVPIKEGENIERALKKFKRKFEKTGVVKELRERQAFTKPSVKKREQKKKAIYIQKMQQDEE